MCIYIYFLAPRCTVGLDSIMSPRFASVLFFLCLVALKIYTFACNEVDVHRLRPPARNCTV